MDTKQKLELALKDAMRAGNDVRKRTIRLVLAAIKLQEVDKHDLLDEPALLAIIQKEVKSHRETIAESQKANRPDLVQAAEEEIAVLEEFLPQSLSDNELLTLVHAVIQETNAATPADIGKVMKVLLPRLSGRAPNDRVSQIVRQELQK